MAFRILAFLGFVFLSFGISSFAQAAPSAKRPHVDVELISSAQSAAPGGTIDLGVYFQLEKGWHVYWQNAGDSGQAPKIVWNLPHGFSAGPIQWPTPHRIEVAPLVDYGYDGAVLLPVTIHIPAGVPQDEAKIEARVRWLVCQESCVPGEATLDLRLPIRPGAAQRSAQATFFDEARVRIPKPLPDDLHVQIVAKAKSFDLQFSGKVSDLTRAPIFFPVEQEIIENATPQVWDASGTTLHLVRSEQLTKTPMQMRGVVDAGGAYYEFSSPVIDLLRPASAGAPTSLADILEALISAFLGGLILNLMPCVFPVLSIKALSFLSIGNQSRREIRVGGIAYAAGILVSFWAFAIVMLILRQSGQELGWGFQLQSPLFIGALSLLLYGMALNLLGVFEVSPGGLTGVGDQLTLLPGWTGSFFTGVLATVVATPCTAPFMGTALGIALGQPPGVAFTIFTALALGLASPYVLLSFYPELGRFLPRPGRWMETLRQLLSFPILGTVLWLVWVFGLQTSLDGVLDLLTAFLALSVGAWAMGRWPGKVSAAFALLTVLLAAALCSSGAKSVAAAREKAVGNPQGVAWEKYSDAKLEELLGQHKRVFVDFTAAWCVTCKVNEHVALDQPRVLEKLKSLGVVLLQGDWTNGDPEITRTLSRYGRNGVPLYLLYAGRSGEAPVILPQILTPGGVLEELDRLR